MPLGATARARAGHRRERLRLALDPIPVAGAGAKSRHDLRAVGESRRFFFPLYSRSSGRLSRQELRPARGVRPRCPRSVPAVRVSGTAPETVGCSLDGGARAVRRLLSKRRAARGSAALAGGELPAQTYDRIRERAELVRLLAVVAPAHEPVTGVHGDATRDAPVRRAHHHQTLRAIQDVRAAPDGGTRARRGALAPPAEGSRARAGLGRRAGDASRDRLVESHGIGPRPGRDARAGGRFERSRGSANLGRDEGRGQRASHHAGGARGVVHVLARARAALGGHQRLGGEVPLIRAPRERAALGGDVRAARAATGERIRRIIRRVGVRAGEIHPPGPRVGL